MQTSPWLRLTDYASKYRVSISTLRRRIKNGQLDHRFEDGRYLVVDEAPRFQDPPYASASTGGQPHMGDLALLETQFDVEGDPLMLEAQERLDRLRSSRPAPEPQSMTPNFSGASAASTINDEPILSSASRLLTELKRAYMNILQEKEEQIVLLKEEVTDLKTLVRVLEDDNDRMRRHLIATGDRR